MQEIFERSYLARAVVVAASSAIVITLVHAAVARDNGGAMQFFNNSVPQPPSESPNYRSIPSPPLSMQDLRTPMARARPLTVHMARRNPLKLRVMAAHAPLAVHAAWAPHGPWKAASPRAPLVAKSAPPTPPIFDFAAAAQDKPVLVSLLQDRTLRRGDAVMTYAGIRIFAGAKVWPYTPRDFMALAAAKSLDLHFRKTLAELDKLPRDYPPGLDQYAIRSNVSTQ